MATALITGIAGQDGSYLAELLVAKGYRVVGVDLSGERSRWLPPSVEYRVADVTRTEVMAALIGELQPAEIYHLAGASSVVGSWEAPAESMESHVRSAAALLDAVRKFANSARVVLASSSEIFGAPEASPQHESSPIAPANPYGVAKAAALWLGRAYRASHGLHVGSAILYNHESPRRPPSFVTRKVTRAVAAIVAGTEQTLTLGNLDARRDWGFAGDVADALWRMAQQASADDYVIGTGEARSVRDFCAAAFAAADLDYRSHVVTDKELFRATDSVTLVADASKARRVLGWSPSVSFDAMVREMVQADLDQVRRVAP